jgi:rubrerythrin
MRRRDLRCPTGCTGGRFEALNAPVYVDSRARYLEHDDSLAAFVCAECQSVAIDLIQAAELMQRDEDVEPQVLVCPQCGTQMLPPLDDELAPFVECPMCETRFALEEGMPHLHGTAFDAGEEA